VVGDPSLNEREKLLALAGDYARESLVS
jgi:hypothetical protein